mmetsp:Transcript_6037/g.9971  ORF Transcript_6037/g.9971 Transcript_6037/m.9971 type:complete len:195 (+) Transcript_6037:11-595(+)
MSQESVSKLTELFHKALNIFSRNTEDTEDVDIPDEGSDTSEISSEEEEEKKTWEPDEYIECFNSLVEAIQDFLTYMKPEAITWNEEEIEDWNTRMTNAHSTLQIAELSQEFLDAIVKEELFNSYKSNYEETIQSCLERHTLKSLADCWIYTEVSIKWSGVIDKFRQDRNKWTAKLTHHFPDEQFTRARVKSARK